MSEKPLDFTGTRQMLSEDFCHLNYGNDNTDAECGHCVELMEAEQILRACTGLTLEQALARLKGGATGEVVMATIEHDPLTGKPEVVSSAKMVNVATEPVVRLADVEDELTAHTGRWPEAKGMATLYSRLRRLAVPAPVVPPGMISVEDVIDSDGFRDLMRDPPVGYTGPGCYLVDGNELCAFLRALAAPAQKVQPCTTCGCEKSVCDGYRATEKKCCPDCNHTQKEEGNGKD